MWQIQCFHTFSCQQIKSELWFRSFTLGYQHLRNRNWLKSVILGTFCLSIYLENCYLGPQFQKKKCSILYVIVPVVRDWIITVMGNGVCVECCGTSFFPQNNRWNNNKHLELCHITYLHRYMSEWRHNDHGKKVRNNLSIWGEQAALVRAL